MESIISACISAGAVLLVGVLTYNFRLRKGLEDISEIKKHESLSKEHEGLSKEHEGLSKEHEGLSKEHEGLSKGNKDLSNKLEVSINKIHDVEVILKEEKIRRENEYGNLSDKQKEITNSVYKLNEFAHEFAKMQLENKMLQERNVELKAENNYLKNENQELKQEIRDCDLER